jgi:hypothetical protein
MSLSIFLYVLETLFRPAGLAPENVVCPLITLLPAGQLGLRNRIAGRKRSRLMR